MDSAYSFRRLQVIAAVAEDGGVRKASQRLALSQPAISQAIGKMEAEVGEALFERGPAGMFLTRSGALFVRRIDRALAYLKTGERELSPGRGPQGPPLHRLATAVQWRAFLAVVENGGFAAAARALGVSQPSIHRGARDLERLAGRPLFRAAASGAEPTAEAVALARWAGLAFREIDQGLDELRERRGLTDGTVVIGSLPLARTRIVPAAVTRLLAERPDARVRIVDGPYVELLDGLRRGRIDLILGALRLPPPAPGLKQEALFQEPLSVVVRAGHPLLSGPAPGIEALTALEWVAPNDRTPARARFTAFFRERGLEPPKRLIECSSLVAIRGLLVQSDRAAFLSASQVPFESLGAELAIAPIPLPGTERSIGVCTRADWSPTATQARTVALIREVAEGLATDAPPTAAPFSPLHHVSRGPPPPPLAQRGRI
jgi:DNA-binding transcriptional LysR family regulator